MFFYPCTLISTACVPYLLNYQEVLHIVESILNLEDHVERQKRGILLLIVQPLFMFNMFNIYGISSLYLNNKFTIYI